jgi:hypothetical protein
VVGFTIGSRYQEKPVKREEEITTTTTKPVMHMLTITSG